MKTKKIIGIVANSVLIVCFLIGLLFSVSYFFVEDLPDFFAETLFISISLVSGGLQMLGLSFSGDLMQYLIVFLPIIFNLLMLIFTIIILVKVCKGKKPKKLCVTNIVFASIRFLIILIALVNIISRDAIAFLGEAPIYVIHMIAIIFTIVFESVVLSMKKTNTEIDGQNQVVTTTTTTVTQQVTNVGKDEPQAQINNNDNANLNK